MGNERHLVTSRSNLSHKINLEYLKGKEDKDISWLTTTVMNNKKNEKKKLYSNWMSYKWYIIIFVNEKRVFFSKNSKTQVVLSTSQP